MQPNEHISKPGHCKRSVCVQHCVNRRREDVNWRRRVRLVLAARLQGFLKSVGEENTTLTPPDLKISEAASLPSATASK